MKSLKYTILSLLFLSTTMHANEESVGQLDLSAETDRYITVFTSGADFQKHEAAEELIWSGLSNTPLFDLIEQDLLSHYKTITSSKKVDLLIWQLKALAASGQDKYIPTFDLVVTESNSKKLRKVAPKFRDYFKQYATWNPIITSIEGNIGNVDQTEARYINMLRSQQLELMRFAAKRIYYTYNQNENVLDIVAEQLFAHADQKDQNKLWLDTLAWMCKALAASDQSKYTEVLEYVIENTTNTKLSRYAQKHLISMQLSTP